MMLHSRPSATRKILLDFDGHITEGSEWNRQKARSSITSPAFSIEGTADTNWTPKELAAIFAIWRGVSEDYSPFDVDVTTEDPGAYLNANGVRIVIGGSSSDCKCQR